jgi:hypothetical protein
VTTRTWRVSVVECDHCGKPSRHVKRLAAEARALASRDGWSRAFLPGRTGAGQGTQDLCPACKGRASRRRT